MLTFIGLGLFDESDISLKGLEAIKNAELVYAEFYTSALKGTDLEKMEKLYGKTIKVLSREAVEQRPDWLKEGLEKDIVFITGGDSMVSTTHVDLRLRAKELGLKTRIIHGASINSAVAGLSGLQNYHFGKSISIPHPYRSRRGKLVITEAPYDTIKLNSELGLHTLVFLDIDKDKGYMTINQALNLLLEVESRRGEGVMKERIAVGIARAGSEKPVVKADYAEKLKDFDFGAPLHILIIPGKLHFIEAEALVKLAAGPESLLQEEK
ncbi:MAG: diphthine synthase [Methanosarcinaceae archaeon]|nr:diphthine synthase [Methanosarcinaceae archaeon]MDD4332292.1 diphthine synthase [Methanosarcinaceae archaeon]